MGLYVFILPYVVSAILELFLMFLSFYKFFKMLETKKPSLASVGLYLLTGFMVAMAFPIGYQVPVIYYNTSISTIQTTIVNITASQVVWSTRIFQVVPWIFFAQAILELVYALYYHTRQEFVVSRRGTNK